MYERRTPFARQLGPLSEAAGRRQVDGGVGGVDAFEVLFFVGFVPACVFEYFRDARFLVELLGSYNVVPFG